MLLFPYFLIFRFLVVLVQEYLFLSIIAYTYYLEKCQEHTPVPLCLREMLFLHFPDARRITFQYRAGQVHPPLAGSVVFYLLQNYSGAAAADFV